MVKKLADPSNAPRVTVLVPSHNRAAELEFAVRSVLAQSYGDFEVFVVLDGCTDDSLSRMEQLDDARGGSLIYQRLRATATQTVRPR